MSFLSPYAGFVALVGIVGAVAWVIAERRRRNVGVVLGLPEPPERQRVSPVVAIGIVALLLGLAATQPTLVRATERQARTDAQAWFVFDTSRSMNAASSPGEPSRFQRARKLALKVRAAIPTVPVGVASITDRALPHLFPSVDPGAFEAVVRTTIGINRPPPGDSFDVRITTLGALAQIASQNYFAPTASRRLLVLFSDGETRPFVDASIATLFRKPPRVHTIFVRMGHEGEHVYFDGKVNPEYIPDPASARKMQRLADATGGVAADEDELGKIVAAARSAVGNGTTRADRREERRLSFAPYLAFAALAPLGFLLYRRNL
jgi:uncharacterized protein (DUF58 family)